MCKNPRWKYLFSLHNQSITIGYLPLAQRAELHCSLLRAHSLILIVVLEFFFKYWFHGGLILWRWGQFMVNTSDVNKDAFLRVAASSNPSFKRDATQARRHLTLLQGRTNHATQSRGIVETRSCFNVRAGTQTTTSASSPVIKERW